MTPHPASGPLHGAPGPQPGTPGAGGRRSAEDLLAVWRARGEVVVEAARPAFLLAFSILLPLSIGVLLLGLVAAGVAVVRSEPSAAVAAAGAFALAIALGVMILTGQMTLLIMYGFALALGVVSAFDNPARQAFGGGVVIAPHGADQHQQARHPTGPRCARSSPAAADTSTRRR